MLPLNNLNHIVVEEEDRLEEIRHYNMERRIMREASDCFSINELRFKDLFRLNKDMARYILNGILPLLALENNPVAIPIQCKFFGALHFYATGSYQRMIGRSHDISMSQQSLSRAIKAVTNAIVNIFGDVWVQFPSTDIQKNSIKQKFMQTRHFPGVIGVVDGTHIEIIRPSEEEHAYLNRKGYHSKNVQIICDSDLRILNINASYGGSTHDAYIWRHSVARQALETSFNNGDRNSWLLGDSGYPLEPWLLTPIENAAPETPEFWYTQAHIQTRNAIERCIGVLKGRFQSLNHILRYSPTQAGNFVNCCAILHNLCTAAGLNNEFEIPQQLNILANDIHIPYQGNIPRQGINTRRTLINQYFM